MLGLTRTPHHEPQDTAAFARGGPLYDATERFLAIRLEMRTADGTRLLSGGGIWDKRLNRWRTPEHLTVLLGDEIAAADQETLGPAHILTVEASQVEYVQAFGQWLKSYKGTNHAQAS